ncbi:sodium-dependent phosphate transport protein 2B-like isoform X1 [Ornithodoros turicata]|uniref:sodium-dependent phosphate transport protein 2B-like isoform X1 n=1 Tax=Ornithodoros turicata TaxID=34597 RepID=UPI0031387C1E
MAETQRKDEVHELQPGSSEDAGQVQQEASSRKDVSGIRGPQGSEAIGWPQSAESAPGPGAQGSKGIVMAEESPRTPKIAGGLRPQGTEEPREASCAERIQNARGSQELQGAEEPRRDLSAPGVPGTKEAVGSPTGLELAPAPSATTLNSDVVPIKTSPRPALEDVPSVTVPEVRELRYVTIFTSVLILVAAIYGLLVALDLLSASFKLIGGRTAGRALSDSQLLKNPIVGLMTGVLVTVLIQSSSSSTSLTVSMVGSNLLSVRHAVPIIMGANVGTSVTNTMVSLMHVKRRDEFCRGFAAATVHDIFNWLTVIVILPCEVAFHVLEVISAKFLLLIADKGGVQKAEFLSVLTKPLVKLIVRIDKKTLELIALGDPAANNRTILLECCKKNGTECLQKCMSLFNLLALGDTATGILCFLLSVTSILLAFYFIVKVLTKLTRSPLVRVLTQFINKDFAFPMSMLVGYLSIALGCGITFIFQSSSAFTSALLPFAALGLLDITRVYPLTLGSNVGTTATGLIAAMAGSPVHRQDAIQIALCHTFFNVIGILIFYPLPCLRVPIFLARRMGSTSGRYRWFVLLYLLLMFLVFPITVLLISLLGDVVLVLTMVTAISLFCLVLLINVLQDKYPWVLPSVLRTWDFLPLWMRSLRPMDKFFTAHLENVKCLQMFLNECSYIT